MTTCIACRSAAEASGARTLRFHATTDAAEQVELPAHLRCRRCSSRCRDRHAIRPAPGRHWLRTSAACGLRGHRREVIELRAAQQCIRAIVIRQGDAQVVVRRERVLDQARQQRIVEAAARIPRWRQGGALDCDRSSRIGANVSCGVRRNRRLRANELLRRRHAGPDIVRPDRARRQQRRRDAERTRERITMAVCSSK